MLWVPDQTTFLHDQLIGRERAVITSSDIRIDVLVTDFYVRDGKRIGKLFIDSPESVRETIVSSLEPLIEIIFGASVGICSRRFFNDFKAPLVYKLLPEYKIDFIRN